MRVAVAFLAAAAFTPTVQAADISIVSFAGPTPIISVSGQIALNDDLKFEQFAQSLKVPAIVKLDSIGGSTLAGIGMGRVIARLGYSTYVGEQKVCASACGLIWLAGAPRMAAMTARVGLHASFIQQANQSVENGAANALVGAYLNSLGFGDRFVVYATSAPPAGMNWLNKSVLDQFGLSVELKNDVATLVTSGAVVPPVVAGSVSSPPSVFQPVSNPLTSEPDETRPAIQGIKPPPKSPEPPKRAASLDPPGQPMEIRPALQHPEIKPVPKPHPAPAPAFPKADFHLLVRIPATSNFSRHPFLFRNGQCFLKENLK